MHLKQRHPHLQVILSVGGGASADTFPVVASSTILRDNFGRSVRGLIEASGLDGIDSKTPALFLLNLIIALFFDTIKPTAPGRWAVFLLRINEADIVQLSGSTHAPLLKVLTFWHFWRQPGSIFQRTGF